MRFSRSFTVTVTFAVLLLSAVSAGAITLTGNFDTDFVGQPGVHIKNSDVLGYGIGAPPLSKENTVGLPLLQPGAVVPSGFHISRIAALNDCSSDSLYIGYDVSNTSTFNSVPTGLTSVAWDADGDGNPCTITNPLLAIPGELDPLTVGNDDIPKESKLEKYDLLLDLNRDGIEDALLSAFDDGAPTAPDAINFADPCGHLIHVTLFGFNGANLLLIPGVSVDLKFGPDIEFRINGVHNIPLSTPPVGSTPTATPYCDIELITFADSDLDASPEVSLDFRDFQFTCPVNVSIDCTKLANGQSTLQICSLPATVTYTLSVTNTGDAAADIHILDTLLAVDQAFTCVAAGQTVTVTKVVTYDSTNCGAPPIQNTMTAEAVLGSCVTCASGVTTDSCSSSATVNFPTKVTAAVTCEKLADGQSTLQITSLPKTVVYTLRATNAGDAPANLNIVDVQLGIDQTFTCVPVGETREITKAVIYDTSYCGHADIVNTMIAGANIGDCTTCVCGITTDSSQCQATVKFPTRVTPGVTCEKLVNGMSTLPICQLPATVIYTLRASNIGDSPANIRITDASLGIDQVFPCVAIGETKEVTKEVTYGTSYCDQPDATGTMTASVDIDGCVPNACGVLTTSTQCSATVQFPKDPGLNPICNMLIDGQSDIFVDVFPKTVTIVLRATNAGVVSTNLRITSTIVELEPLGYAPVDELFPCVPAGEFREVTRTVTIPLSFKGHSPILGAMVVHADVDGCMATPCGCGLTATDVSCRLGIQFEPPKLLQAYPGNSNGLDAFQMGYQGQTGDTITAVPGVFTFIPGNRWSNFVTAAQAGVEYTIKNVVLTKQTPELVQCADVFPVKTITQQGTANIRTWWPLTYEAPGTTWKLTILYGTTVAWDDDGAGPNPPGYVHTDTWMWTVDASLQSMKNLLALFRQVPFGTSEVPLISDETLYAALQQKLTDIIALVEAGQNGNAGLLLGDFEMEVADACITVAPAFPNFSGPGTGIANTLENPACCKLLVDAGYVGAKLVIFTPSK